MIQAPNFYVAIYDKVAKRISFPYFVDNKLKGNVKKKAYNKRSFANGLTEYVIANNKPLLLTSANFADFIRDNNIDPNIAGTYISRIGAPGMSNNNLIGMIGVSSYHNELQYDDEDLQIGRASCR